MDGGSSVTVTGNNIWAVNARSAHVDLTKKVLLALSSVEATVVYAQLLGNIPARKDAADNKDFQALTELVPIHKSVENGAFLKSAPGFSVVSGARATEACCASRPTRRSRRSSSARQGPPATVLSAVSLPKTLRTSFTSPPWEVDARSAREGGPQALAAQASPFPNPPVKGEGPPKSDPSVIGSDRSRQILMAMTFTTRWPGRIACCSCRPWCCSCASS
jgi:hypothetical protein